MAALVLGIVAIVGSLIPILNILSILLAVIGLALGILGLLRAKRPGFGGRGMALAGIILSVLAILGAILADVVFGAAVTSATKSVNKAVASATASASPSASQTVQAQYPGQQRSDVVVQGGGTVTVNGMDVTASPLVPSSNSVGQFLCSTVTYKNNGGSSTPFNSFDWKLQDPKGAARTGGVFGENNLNSGDLAAGGTVTGNVCFDGAAEPGQYVLFYEAPSLFSGARGAFVTTI